MCFLYIRSSFMLSVDNRLPNAIMNPMTSAIPVIDFREEYLSSIESICQYQRI